MSARSHPAGPKPPRRLSGEDAVFVHAEVPSMPMHSLGTLILDPSTVPGGARFDRAHLIRHVKKRIHQMPPFRQRLLEVPLSLGSPVLADDPEFRVEDHVHRVVAQRPGSPRELARVVEEIASQRLDRSKPLWEMWLVEGLADGRCAVVTKMHHCMIDGASGASQMANLLDFAPDTESPKPPRFRPGPLPSGWELMRDALANARDPRELASLVQSTAVGLVDSVRAGNVTSLLPDTPRTPWSGAAGTRRRVAFGSAALDDIKIVKTRFGVTVNDAVLAACTLMLRRYLEARAALPEEPLVCAVPVSVKSEEELRHFSNKVSVMSVRLPTHLDDPAAIVRAVHEESEAAKRSFEASNPELMLGWLDWTPGPLVTIGARLFTGLELANRVPLPWNCVVSNMRGAPFPLYFAGARVLATYPMGPAGDGVGLNITVLSNMGRLDFGVLAAGDAVPDVWDLADGFAAAVDELRALAERPGAIGATGGA
jgi:WS/DGAT/MGAT family acyltransferase